MFSQFDLAINYLVAGQGILLTYLILVAPGTLFSSRYMLAIFLLIQSNVLIINTLDWQTLSPLYTDFTGGFYYLLGPLFYFYVKLLVSPSYKFGLRHLVHALPMVLAVVVTSYNNDRAMLQDPEWYGRDSFSMVFMILPFAGLCLYAAAAMCLLNQYQHFIHESYSTLDNISLAWLQRIVIFSLISSGLLVIAYVLSLFELLHRMQATYGLRLWNIVQIYLIAVAGCRSHIFSFGGSGPVVLPSEPVLSEEVPVNIDRKKYQRTGIDENEAQVIWQALNQYMEQQPYTDSELDLNQVATALGVSRHQLSQVINTCSGENFFGFVNHFRALKARDLIDSCVNTDSQASILDISLEAGFTSTSTFYKHFKKHFRVTPSQYRKQCQTLKNNN
jgi:AraC-like DNA-binding protein